MEIKAIASKPDSIEGRTVTGLAAVFGNVDSGSDIIHEGAFRKTIKENARRFQHLWQHDYNSPPTAKIEEVKEVGRSQIPAWIKEEYPEVTGGLLVKRTYLETPRGDEVLEGIRGGAIKEMSIGYDPVKFDYEIDPNTKASIRNLREVKLFDTSDVVWGMNSLTAAAKNEENQGLKTLYKSYLETTPENKAGALAMLLQNTAGHLMTAADVVTPEIEQSIKSLMDLLTAEPRTADELDALTEELKARIEIAYRELAY